MDHHYLPSEDDAVDLWEFEEECGAGEPSPWRRRVITVVALLAALSLAAGPLYNLIDRGQPQVAENGLEVCGFDYCVIQDVIRGAGLDVEMGRLANTILTEEEALVLTASLAGQLQIEPVELAVVERLGGRLGGIYDPSDRTIVIERPATAWVVTHEVAHAVAAGHGPEFQEALIGLIQLQD